MRRSAFVDRHWSPKGFVRGLATVFSGTVVAQLVGLAVLPIFARLFVPEAFGHLQIYQAMLTVLAIAVTARLEFVLLRCTDDEAASVVRSGFAVVVAIAAFFGLALAGLNALSAVPVVGSMPFAPGYLVLAIAATGMSNLIFYRLLRSHRFGENALLRLSQSLIYATVGLALGIANPTIDGLILADLAGRIVALAYGVVVLERSFGIVLFPLPRLGQIGEFLSRHRALPSFALPGALTNAGGAAMTPLFIYSTYGAAAAGQYGLVDRALGLPVSMVVGAVSQVFAARFSELLRAHDASGPRLFRNVVVGSGGLAVIGVLLAWWIIEPSFPAIFGDGWHEAGALSRTMLLAYGVSFVAGAVNQSLVILGRYRLQMCWDFAWLVSFAVAWSSIISLNLPLAEAVMIHAVTIIVLQLGFIVLADRAIASAFRDSNRPADAL